jgi:hypothetical protein
MARSAKEEWDTERKRRQAELSRASQEALTFDRAAELAKFNEDDLKVAKGIRAKAAMMMKDADSPADLRSLSASFETAQRIGRLALGAETEVATVKTQEIPYVSIDEFV